MTIIDPIHLDGIPYNRSEIEGFKKEIDLLKKKYGIITDSIKISE